MITLGETGLYYGSIPPGIITELTLRTSSYIQGLKSRVDTVVQRGKWNHPDDEGVNFREVPIQDGDMVDIASPLGLEPRILKPFEAATVMSALIYGSVREHDDRKLGYEDLCTLFIPLSLPGGVAEFGTGKGTSKEAIAQLKIGSAVCFDQNYLHHVSFDASKSLGTGITLFVTRASFLRLLAK